MKTLLRIIAMVALTMLMLSLTKCGTGDQEEKKEAKMTVCSTPDDDLQQKELTLTVL